MSATSLSTPFDRRRLPGSFGRLRWHWTVTVVWGEEVRRHPKDCLVMAWQTRFGKNAILSIGAWVCLYCVFNIEVYCLGVEKHLAKLLWSPMGVPSGLAIQWYVFGDRVEALRRTMGLRRMVGRLSWRFVLVKLASFGANQYAFALAAVVLASWTAAPAAAAFMSVLNYLVTLRWITKGEETETA